MATNNSDRKDDKIILWVFDNDKKAHDKQPDWKGNGRISKAVLKDLVDCYKDFGEDDSLQLECAGWRKEGKNGPYTFMLIEPKRPRDVKKDDEVPF